MEHIVRVYNEKPSSKIPEHFSWLFNKPITQEMKYRLYAALDTYNNSDLGIKKNLSAEYKEKIIIGDNLWSLYEQVTGDVHDLLVTWAIDQYSILHQINSYNTTRLSEQSLQTQRELLDVAFALEFAIEEMLHKN